MKPDQKSDLEIFYIEVISLRQLRSSTNSIIKVSNYKGKNASLCNRSQSNIVLCPELNLKWLQTFELLGVTWKHGDEYFEKIDQINKITKNRKYVANWSMRSCKVLNF